MNYGIIVEFNPLHNGHKYLLDSVKESDDDTVTVVMSESFVQRGETAAVSPYARTEMALSCGADLVLSLPVPYATAGAERFALGGVGVLGNLGVIDCLAFGSESGDKTAIKGCADILDSYKLKPCLDKYLSEGVSFPTARQMAVKELSDGQYDKIMMSPNDILGIEYVKAINTLDFNIDFAPVKRCRVLHDSEKVNRNFCSASALRERIFKGTDIERFMPDSSYEILKREALAGKAPVNYKTLETALLYKLRTMSVEEIGQLPDVTEGLEYRIYESVKTTSDLDSLLEKIKTRRYTHSRLRRIAVCALLGIKKDDVTEPVPYIRVLGFNNNGAELLKKAKTTATLPIVTKAGDINSLSDNAKRVFDLECTARDIFSLAQPVPTQCGQVKTDKIITF